MLKALPRRFSEWRQLARKVRNVVEHSSAAGGARRETGLATGAETAGSRAAGSTSCASDGAEDLRREGTARLTQPGRPTPVAWSYGEREPEQGRELLDASLQRQDLAAKGRLRQVRPMDAHHGIRRSREPRTRR